MSKRSPKDRFKVTADIRNIVVDSSESAIQVKFVNATNDRQFRPPVTRLAMKKGKLNISRKNLRQKISESDNFEIAKAEVTKARLTKNGSSIELVVMEDDESIAYISIGRGTISIGRSRNDKEKYKWDQLHRILSYGHKVATELRARKHDTIKLLVLNENNCVVVDEDSADEEFDLPDKNKKHKSSRRLILNKKNKVISMSKLD